MTIALILISGFSAWSNDENDSDDSQIQTEGEADVASSEDSAGDVEEGSTAAVETDQSTDFEDFLEELSQEQPSDTLGQAQVRTAGSFGARADQDFFSSSELTHGPAIGAEFDSLAEIRHDSGYMRRGMEQHFGERIVANIHVRNLFDRYSSLRSQAGVSLPSGFAPLVNFVEQYIKSNDLDNAEASNGFSHRTLAINVIRASFCFGNDPFMILAKMRRETNFSRKSVSPTGAVGFSQMTGIGVKEVQHQLSGDSKISLPQARTAFRQSIRCFSGINNYVVPRGSVENLKDRISQRWGFDMVFGQILVKTLVSYAKASQAYGNNTGGVVAAYQDAFTAYNGDTQMTQGRCTGRKSVQMREEYSCDVIQQFNRMNAQWNRFIVRSTGKDMT